MYYSIVLLYATPTNHDVVTNDSDPVIAIGTRVLVPESHNVSQLVNNNAKLVTVLPNGYGLRSVATFSHEGTTSGKERGLGFLTILWGVVFKTS